MSVCPYDVLTFIHTLIRVRTFKDELMCQPNIFSDITEDFLKSIASNIFYAALHIVHAQKKKPG